MYKEIRSSVDDSIILSIISGKDDIKDGLHFYGTKNDFIQVGGFKYSSGKVLRNHTHINRKRKSIKTQEIMVVLSGECIARVYDINDILVHQAVLRDGQFIIVYNGGIGFTIVDDDTIMIEAKNGPYDVNSDDEDRRLIQK